MDKNRTTSPELPTQVLARVLHVLDGQVLGETSGGDMCPGQERAEEPNHTRGFVVKQFE